MILDRADRDTAIAAANEYPGEPAQTTSYILGWWRSMVAAHGHEYAGLWLEAALDARDEAKR